MTRPISGTEDVGGRTDFNFNDSYFEYSMFGLFEFMGLHSDKESSILQMFWPFWILIYSLTNLIRPNISPVETHCKPLRETHQQ